MSYAPGYSEVVPPMIGPFTWGWSAVASKRVASEWPASAAIYVDANLAFYFPVLVPATCVVRRAWWANGRTVSASQHFDAGIYADAGYKPGTRLVSTGSTAQGTALNVQFTDVTDTTLPPGLHWFALASDDWFVSTTMMRRTASTVVDAAVRFQEASAFPLPTAATPAEASSEEIPLFGFATTASP